MTTRRPARIFPSRPVPARYRIPIIARVILAIALAGVSGRASAQQEFFPFAGKINVKSVHVRAGQSKNFESLGQMKLDDPIVVEERSYSWYKVRLPKNAKSYLSRDYIRMISAKVGEVTADRVNIRAGAGINFSVLGQANEGDRVLIADDSMDEWIRIRPVPETFGWIREDYIDFVSSDAGADRWLDDKELALLEKAAAEAEKRARLAAEAEAAALEEPEPDPPAAVQTSFTGVLTENPDDSGFEYTLVNNGDGTYYLDGFSQLLKPFVNYRVKIEGHLKTDPAVDLSHPVVVVSRIQLIL